MNITRDDKQANMDVVGPLNAFEADRFVESLRVFDFVQMGGPHWATQHECLQQLNMQAHINASQSRDEFVVEALVLHEKLPLLVRELIACELWKQNAYPLLAEHISRKASVKGYLLLFHEAVIANLLEAVLYHPHACEAAADVLPELVDYCHRKLVWLLAFKYVPPPPRPSDKEELKKLLMREMEEEDHLETQRKTIDLSIALYALSILRFLSEQIVRLPLAVASRLLDTYDVLMLLVPLLEEKPWEHRASDGTLRRFVQGRWVVCSDADRRAMAKSEAQVWLTVYSLMAEPEVRRKYELNSFRKATLLRTRGLLNEPVVDQLPLLVDLQRTLDELSMTEVPSAATARPAYLLEAVPELREHLSRGVDWSAVAAQMRAGTLDESDEERRATARRLAALYDLDGMDAMVEGGAPAPLAPMQYFVEVAVLDADGKEAARLTCGSEEPTLGEAQQAFKLANEQKRLLLPADRCFSLAASLNSGEGRPWEVRGPLELADDKKKQWVQLGLDPHALRLQLHFLRDAEATNPHGFHLIHCRATPPLLQRLSLIFSPVGEGAAPVTIRATGRGLNAQTTFAVDGADAGVRVPRACSARAVLECAGSSYASEEVPLELGASSQMIWRQLGKFSTELRVQMRLAPAAGGYTLTALRVTAPPSMRAVASTLAPASQDSAFPMDVDAASPEPPHEADAPAAPEGAGAAAETPSNAPRAAPRTEPAPPPPAPPATPPQPPVVTSARGAAERAAATRKAVTASAASQEARAAAAEAAAASARAAAAEAACDAEPEDGGVMDVTEELEKAAKAKEIAQKAAARAQAAARVAAAAVAAAAAAADALEAAEDTSFSEPAFDQGPTDPATAPADASSDPAQAGEDLPNKDATADTTAVGRTPRHSVSMKGGVGEQSVVVVVDLPGVKGMRELNVEMSATRLQLSGGGYALDLPLPAAVDIEHTSAKFSTKTSQLKVTVAAA
jgi:HSP20 family molecular chaperone IbpA